jgi:hypothetical protein
VAFLGIRHSQDLHDPSPRRMLMSEANRINRVFLHQHPVHSVNIGTASDESFYSLIGSSIITSIIWPRDQKDGHIVAVRDHIYHGCACYYKEWNGRRWGSLRSPHPTRKRSAIDQKCGPVIVDQAEEIASIASFPRFNRSIISVTSP